MRRGLALLLLPVAACSSSGGGGGSANPYERALAATVTAAGTGGGDCVIRWNGRPVSRAALLENGLKMNREALERLDETQRSYPPGEHHEYGDVLPHVRLEAARGVPYSCFGPALRTLERSGSFEVLLRPAGERVPDYDVQFAEDPAVPGRRYAALLRLGAGDRMTWDGETVDLVGLGRRARALDPRTLVPVAVAPSADSDFMTLYEAVRVVGDEYLVPTLSGCAGTLGPTRDPPIC